MPNQPPKRWWISCVKGVSKSKKAYDPEAVCGNLWHHKKTLKERVAITRKEESRKRNR